MSNRPTIAIANTVIRWCIDVYDPTNPGVSINPDATPVVRVYLDTVDLGLLVTITPDAVEDGLFWCSLDLAAETAGQTYIIRESMTINGSVVRSHFAVTIIDAMRGTDSAATAAELATTQAAIIAAGDARWITAQGFAVPGDSMALSVAERDALATVVDARLLDAGDATDLIAGIVARVNNTNVDESLLVAAIRNDLERAGGHLQTLIDRPVSPTAAEVAATTAAEVLATPANKLATDATGRVTTSNLAPGVDHTAELAAIAATQVTIGETLDKIPQVGKTHRWTNAGNGAGFDEITLTEV